MLPKVTVHFNLNKQMIDKYALWNDKLCYIIGNVYDISGRGFLVKLVGKGWSTKDLKGNAWFAKASEVKLLPFQPVH